MKRAQNNQGRNVKSRHHEPHQSAINNMSIDVAEHNLNPFLTDQDIGNFAQTNRRHRKLGQHQTHCYNERTKCLQMTKYELVIGSCYQFCLSHFHKVLFEMLTMLLHGPIISVEGKTIKLFNASPIFVCHNQSVIGQINKYVDFRFTAPGFSGSVNNYPKPSTYKTELKDSDFEELVSKLLKEPWFQGFHTIDFVCVYSLHNFNLNQNPNVDSRIIGISSHGDNIEIPVEDMYLDARGDLFITFRVQSIAQYLKSSPREVIEIDMDEPD
jgi:hypothetical protein